MHSSREELPVTTQIGGYESRTEQWGDMVVAFEKIPAALDVSPYLAGLPDNMCHCPHWGYLLKGRLLVKYKDHHEEIPAGSAYYVPPGHLVTFLEDCETIEFSPAAEQKSTSDIVGQNA